MSRSFASGNLDEYRIADLIRAGAPIDAFGVGTALTVSDDAPSADYTYKLADYLGRPRLKTSAGKITVPGRKQVFRGIDASGHFSQDLVGLVDETPTSVTREFKPAVSKITPTAADGVREWHGVIDRGADAGANRAIIS